MKKVTNKIKKRDVSPFLQWLRDRMFGRKTSYGIRFEQDISDRSQPDPDLPDGPSHKLYGNYYFLRDARRLVTKPLSIAGPDEFLKLPFKENLDSNLSVHAGVRPGLLYNPDKVSSYPIRDPTKLEKLNKEKKN